MLFILSCTESAPIRSDVQTYEVITSKREVKDTLSEFLAKKDYNSIREKYEGVSLAVTDISADPFVKVARSGADPRLALWIAKKYKEPFVIKNGKRITFLEVLDQLFRIENKEYDKDFASLANSYELEDIEKVSFIPFKEDLLKQRWCKYVRELDDIYQSLREELQLFNADNEAEKDRVIDRRKDEIKAKLDPSLKILKEIKINPLSTAKTSRGVSKPFIFYVMLAKDKEQYDDLVASEDMEEKLSPLVVEFKVLSTTFYDFWEKAKKVGQYGKKIYQKIKQYVASGKKEGEYELGWDGEDYIYDSFSSDDEDYIEGL